MTSQRRSARVPIPKRHFEDVSAFLPQKKRQKTAQIKLEYIPEEVTRVDAPAVVTTPPLVTARALNTEPTTAPPIPVSFEDIKIHWIEQEPIDLFLRFFDSQSLLVIVQSTNARAAREISKLAKSSTHLRRWHPVS